VPPSFPPILATSHGVILDVGPGAGDQLFRFTQTKDIKAIYGVEPGIEMHAALRENANRAGLGQKYKIMPCGAEPEFLIPAMAKEGLLSKTDSLGDGVFDEIVCCRVLCGVPKPGETIDNLYRCLKPGGRFVVCEHVVSDEDTGLGRFLQHFYMTLGWSFWCCGCELTRDTVSALMKAAQPDGGWAEVKLERVDAWSPVPHMVGFLTKKS